MYLPVLPIIVLSAMLDPDNGNILTSEDFGGWNLPSHLIFFVSGFVLASSPAMQASVRQIRWISLIMGLVIFFGGAGLLLVLTGILLCMTAWYGWVFVRSSQEAGLTVSVLEWPAWMIQAVIPIGILSAALRYFIFAAWPACRPTPPEFQE